MTEFLEIATRAYTEPLEPDQGKRSSPDEQAQRLAQLLKGRQADNHRPVLSFDTETRTDPSQRLMLGAYRFCRWQRNQLVCVAEGLIYPEDLPEDDAAQVRGYWQRHKLDTAADQSIFDAAPALALVTERQFVKLLYNVCVKPGPKRAAVLVGLNLNFDVSRLAVHWGEARTRYPGGFSLQLAEGYVNAEGKLRESKFHPRFCAKHLSSTKSLKGFLGEFAGHVIDVRTLMFALTNRGYSLERGCDAFGVKMSQASAQSGYDKRKVIYGVVSPEALHYCRDDVQATHLLYEKVMREYDRHPIPLQATQALSPASIGKGYLAGMGIRPRSELQPDFPREQLGVAMSAFYGGRTECRIRKVPVPVVYCDLMSAYTTGNSLMDLWRFVIAEGVELADVTAQARRLVDEIDLEACLNPETWPGMTMLVQIEPQGDVLPVRAHYKGRDGWNIGSNPLWFDGQLWYALPDVIASKLLTGRAPRIIRALALQAAGQQTGLKPIKLRGQVEVDPRENFFAKVIEQRHELPDKKGDTGEFLKTVANSASYGIYAEMICSELAGSKTDRVLTCGSEGIPFEEDQSKPERPGRYFFAPMAALITAGTRLLLAITERMVTDAGGTWAMMDTDSIAIVSTESGGLVECPGGPERDKSGREYVRALSWDQVDAIRTRCKALNPYGGKAQTKPILELEGENYTLDPTDPERERVTDERQQLHCYAISSKRYCLYNLGADGAPQLRGATEPDQPAEREGDRTAGTGGQALQRQPDVRKRSYHGLGYLLNPVDPESGGRDWILTGWDWIIRSALRLPAPEPEWFDQPALMRAAVTTPRLLANFARYNEARPQSEKIRPFNFVMVAQQQATSRDPTTNDVWPQAIEGEKCALIAPYESDPAKWTRITWTNHYEPGSEYHIATEPRLVQPDETVAVRTLRHVFDEYRSSPEPKSLGADGQPCGRDTIGLLGRRPVRAISNTLVGKEMKAHEEQLIRIRQTEDERINSYHQPGGDDFARVRQALHALAEPVEQTARDAQVSERVVKRARAGEPVSAESQRKLTRHAVRRARAALRVVGLVGLPRDEIGASLLATYLHHYGQRLCDCGCGRPVSGRAKHHDQSCRQAAYRERRAA